MIENNLIHAVTGWAKKFIPDCTAEHIDSILTWGNQAGQTLISMHDENYPAQLLEIHAPPPLLFIKGQVEALFEPQIAIVGCRQMSPYGAENAFQFAKALAEIGVTVTSGLAIGIDTLAHQGALAAKGRTIAVLGTGLHHIYPGQNKILAETISHEGALVSEFPLNTPPYRYNFPKRNRIISGLTMGVLVIEAAEKSGSLITAHFALEQNREVFAIPGSIQSPVSRGCHQLITEGATLVQSLSDLLIHIKEKLQKNTWALPHPIKSLHSRKKNVNSIKKHDHPLLNFFSQEPVPLDAILAETGQSIEKLTDDLLMLELKGVIKMVAGGYILT